MPTPATKFVRQQDGTYKKESFVQAFDDGIRDNTTREGLAALQPVFAAGGTVTAGNSSQTTDGAAAAVIMSENMVKELDLKPVAKLKYYTTIGCRPDEMGVGPRYAIPKLLDKAGLTIDDIGAWEINEAFASQAKACLDELGIPYEEASKDLYVTPGPHACSKLIAAACDAGVVGPHPVGVVGSTGRKKRVKYGADLVHWGYGAFFALKGNKTNEFWRYVVPPPSMPGWNIPN